MGKMAEDGMAQADHDHHHDRYDVVIAGGSFVGLALARAFAVADPGLRIAVIDKRPLEAALSAAFDGRASALSAASVAMLAHLGMWQAVAEAAQPVTAIEITDSALDAPIRPVFLHFDNRTAAAEPASYMLENHLLRRAMAEVVLADASIDVLEGMAVERGQAEGGGIQIQLSGGRTLVAALLVGADGRRSAVRRIAGIKTLSWDYPQSGIVTTVAHERPHHGKAVQHFLPAGPFAILPLRGQRASLVWTEERQRAAQIMALDDEWFLDELTRRFGHKLGILQLAGPRQSWPLSFEMARDFTAQRVALVGDAAHGVHPIAGQGLNIGLRDAAALAQVCVEAGRLGLDMGGVQVLERYQRWRRFDAVTSALAMDGLNRLFTNDIEPLRLLRSTGLSLVERLPRLKDMFVQEAAGLAGRVPNLLRGEAI